MAHHVEPQIESSTDPFTENKAAIGTTTLPKATIQEKHRSLTVFRLKRARKNLKTVKT